jgi:hypothetical protein
MIYLAGTQNLSTPFPHWLHLPSGVPEGFRLAWTDGRGPDFQGDPAAPAHDQPVAALSQAALAAQAAWVRQVHGGTVLQARGPGCRGEADALWTDHPGLAVIGRSADCPLVLVAGTRDDGRPVAGFAHASWRSTVRGITARLIETMTGSDHQAACLEAFICPSAGPCCYEVGPEVRDQALEHLGTEADRFFLARGDRFHLDLWAANVAQLEAGGLPPASIQVARTCTICASAPRPDTYPSYRRQGDQAGRFAGLAMINVG